MVLVQRDDVVQQLSSATADPTLGHPVLPRAPHGGLEAGNVHGSNCSRDFHPILGVMIKDEELGRRRIWKAVPQLLADPGASRMTRA
jgi:hypothetical protein